MARFSLPGGRFKVWEALADAYAHTELATNWDTIDGIMGAPSSGTWPPDQGIDGGIYKEVGLIKKDRVAIGSVISWYRPGSGVSLPTGWVVCDGSTVTVHDFVGFGGSFVLPDLRNKFILGASSSITDGTAATSGDLAANAPGIRGAGGAASTSHTHTMPHHYHYHKHTHGYTDSGTTSAPPSGVGFINHVNFGGSDNVANDSHKHNFSTTAMTTNARDQNSNFNDNAGKFMTTLQVPSPTGGDDETPTGGTQGANFVSLSTTLDNRPTYYGLLYIMKVKYSTTL